MEVKDHSLAHHIIEHPPKDSCRSLKDMPLPLLGPWALPLTQDFRASWACTFTHSFTTGKFHVASLLKESRKSKESLCGECKTPYSQLPMIRLNPGAVRQQHYLRCQHDTMYGLLSANSVLHRVSHFLFTSVLWCINLFPFLSAWLSNLWLSNP